VTLAAGQEFTITGEDVPGDQGEVSVSHRGLAGDVRPGTQLLVDDGRVVLEVIAVQGSRVRTRVLVGGRVSDHKGLNLPGVRVSVPALTSKDADDLRWALGLRADMIALSFVQGPEDAEPPRKIMDEMGVRRGGRADALRGDQRRRLPRRGRGNSPPGTPGRTNALRVHRIGDAVGS
jgi:pyruvate kinase